MNYLPILLQHLQTHSPFDVTEMESCARTRAFLQAEPAPFSRTTAAGHITASAVVLNANRTALLLIWHEKLQRWLQPGGHCEPEYDASLPDAARRELIEETGIPAHAITLLQDSPFDVDVHPIPARGQEPDHFHYDIRYLFQTTVQPRLAGCRWMPLAEAAALPDPSLARYAHKLRAPKKWD